MELNEGEREFYRALLERSKAVYRGLEVSSPLPANPSTSLSLGTCTPHTSQPPPLLSPPLVSLFFSQAKTSAGGRYARLFALLMRMRQVLHYLK